MKKSRLLLTTLLLTSVMSITAFAGEWKQNQVGWWYQNNDGSYPASSWIQDNGKWYHFDSQGYMQTGWFKDTNSTWYYLTSSGEMQTESITLEDGITYHFNTDGSCLNRWAGLADTNYYNVEEEREKSVGADAAEQDIIDRLTGGTLIGY